MSSEDQPLATVLVVGAHGANAGLVVPALAARGARVRGLIRDAGQADAVRRSGAAETVVGDLTDPASVERALDGVASVFYVAPAFIPREAEIGQQFVAAARRAGVRKIVFSSVIHPVLSELENHAAKAPVEEAIVESGMTYALLQPTLFFQMLAGSWSRIVSSGVHAEPWSADTAFSRVDYRDVAEVAAIALTEDRLDDGTYQLCAEGHLDRTAVAALISDVLGRTIRVGTATPPQPSGDASTSPMQAMMAWYNHHGLLGNALTLRAVLGREPRSLRDYVQELADAGPDQ